MKTKCDTLTVVIKMKKKFKELRATIFCLILFLIFLLAGIYYLIMNMIPRMIAMMILGFIALLLLVGRFQLILFDDAMILYEWKFIAFVPIMVDYQDIQSIERKSKYHCIVHHQHKTQVYVFNSDQFIKVYQELSSNNKI